MSGADGRPNRLAAESSPYLLLHARNPVDWHPWGAEAIARARAEDKPIFLSVGYSTCYWCHVMERESFSDPAVAAEMNRDFVNVKVDREERPDLDEIYMLATQILTGQGGWPNSVFLTPQLEPFFAGTYFPPRDAHGRPGFPTVLRSLVHAWRERRGEVEAQAAELGAAIRRHLDEIEPLAGALPGGELALRSLAALRERFDPTWGGFGERPKFPTPSNLWLLEALLDGTVPVDAAGDATRPFAAARGAERPVSSRISRPVSSESPRAVPSPSLRSASSMMLEATLGAMARGGLCDQLAGGFHRYATDREWRIPHFEKMLYDNGLLLELYARQHARTGRPEPARVAAATAGWLGREMTSPEGALWSAVDAETAGHEGAYYVWTRSEIDAVLGAEDAGFLAPLYGFADEPFFEGEAYVLHLPRPLEVQAAARRTTREALLAEIEPLAAKLLEARGRRERPATDDKILADWNGTAIAGFAVAGRALGRSDLVERAARAAEFVLATMQAPDGTLLHSWRAGAGRIPAFLSDYVFLVRGLLRLHAASGEARWLDEARRLAEEQERRLASPRGGYFNAVEADDLLVRGKELFDGALPAANGVAALDLLELHAATGEAAYLARAERTLRAFAPIVETHPEGARTLSIAFAAFERAAAGGGEPEPETRSDFEATAETFVEGKGSGARTSTAEGASAAPGAGATLAGEVGIGAAFVAPGAAPSSDPTAMRDASDAGLAAIEPPVVTLGDSDAEGWQPFVLRLTVRDGWHLSVESGLPTLAGSGATLMRVEWPTGRPLGSGGAGDPKLPIFEGAIEVRGRLRREAPGASLRLRFVACGDGRCLPPAEIEVTVP